MTVVHIKTPLKSIILTSPYTCIPVVYNNEHRSSSNAIKIISFKVNDVLILRFFLYHKWKWILTFNNIILELYH